MTQRWTGRPFRALRTAALVVAPLAIATPAHALTVEASAVVAQDPETPGAGQGFEGRLGLGIPTPGVHLSPELGLGYTRFDQSQWIRAVAGGALTVGKTLRPGVYAHAGFARDLMSADAGVTWDAGGVLDLAALPLLTVGLRGGWTALPQQRGHLGAGLTVSVGF